MTKFKLYGVALTLTLTLVACTQPSSSPTSPSLPLNLPLGSPSSGPLLSAQSVNLNAGGSSITLNVGSVPSGQTVAWSLTPAGAGTLVANGSSATYTPPATLAQTTNVTITAKLSGGASGSLVLTVLPNTQTTTPAPNPAPSPSSDQSTLLGAINAVRAVGRTCGTTAFPAAPALKWNALLERAALLHSQDMASNNYFNHDSRDGRKPWDRMAAQGYNYGAAAENIAAGQPDLAAVMDSWVKSPGHCANLMSAAYSEVGMARAENAASTYRIYWTQDFASPR